MSCIAATGAGRVEGSAADGLEVYRGIPYAAPPIGPLRFAPPQPPIAWSGVRRAQAPGADAPQPPSPMGFDASDNPQSEDCLTLNVWTPGCDAARRPVMVWIHGGGFSTGGANRAMYDGHALAKHGDLVFVSVQYRLGVLGCLTHEALADASSGVSSNWSLLDQQAALRWVRDNIAAFGGDPTRVTLFGESAGGVSTALQCVAPTSKGLFARAIVQSGSPEPISREQSLEATRDFLEAVAISGGDVAAQLRALPVAEILAAQPAWAAVASRGRTAPRPCLDGVFLPHWPNDAAAAGATADLDLIVGSNRDEAKIFLFMDPRRGRLEPEDLQRRLTEQFGDAEIASRVTQTIRSAREARGEAADAWEIFCAVFTDRMIRVPSTRFLEAHTARGGRGRSYLFGWESPVKGLGACHGLEIPFCLGTLHSAEGMAGFAGSGAAADELMKTMHEFWIAFAREDLPVLAAWPAFDGKRRASMFFGADSEVIDAPREPERALLAEIDFGLEPA